jgi:hypothetical protein
MIAISGSTKQRLSMASSTHLPRASPPDPRIATVAAK